MKVNIDVTVEVTDQQRVDIASVIDNKVSRRIATREELKRFIWGEGETWHISLADQLLDMEAWLAVEAQPDPRDALDDLL